MGGGRGKVSSLRFVQSRGQSGRFRETYARKAGITMAWIGDYLLRTDTDSYYSDISEALEKYNAEAVH